MYVRGWNAIFMCLSVLGVVENTRSKVARVVTGVDLRSTAGNCAWVRTPQLASFVESSTGGGREVVDTAERA